MTVKYTLAVFLCTFSLFSAGPPAAQQKVLVLCSAGNCEYRRIGLLLADGKSSVRAIPSPAETIGVAQVRNSRELKIDQIPGIYRNPASGVFYALDGDEKPGEILVPPKFKGGDAAPPGSTWRTSEIQYCDTLNSKAGTAVPLERFAYLLNSADAEQTVFQFLRRHLDAPETDALRLPLIKGALQFMAKSTVLKQFRDSLMAKMSADLKRFDEAEGDPTTLVDCLHDAVRLRAIYLQIADDKQQQELLDGIAATDNLFTERLAIAEILRKASYWDEYLIKVKQLGMAKWSGPNILANSLDALNQSSELHYQRSLSLAKEDHLDRAFDEAALAARNSCQISLSEYFYNTRVLLVDHNKISAAAPYVGSNRALLEQIVRELDQLDPNKEQLTLDRIREGERLDPNFLPLQWKKAEFLDKLGKYTEALEVIRRIERTVPLDQNQLEVCLALDGRINTNLKDSIQKAQAETRKQFGVQHYQQALDAAVVGLKAAPDNPSLLYYSALSSAFLRQYPTAMQYVRRYLAEGKLVCAPAKEPEIMLDVYRLLLGRTTPHETANGIPHWISGARYRPSDVFYDPISMGFLQPVRRIDTKDGVATIFEREARSFLVESIVTEFGSPKGSGITQSASSIFEAEPKYDRQSLSMLEIGSRATSVGERTVHALTYLNSPGVDPDLVLRFTGNQVARGWAGNPFFHPFIWSGFYVFDLTYDRLGRMATATPIPEETGSRTDPFSEPLQFTWDGDSKRLLSIRGTRSGYVRELVYEKDGRLKSEKISYPKGHGSIDYEYLPGSSLLKGAKSEDNFYDKRERLAVFDSGGGPR